jgi:hypothetical protein
MHHVLLMLLWGRSILLAIFIAPYKDAVENIGTWRWSKEFLPPPGQGSKDLSKEDIVCCIMEKEFTNQLITGQAIVGATASGTDSAPAEVQTVASPSIVTIHDNFQLVNVMFCEKNGG